MDKKKNIKGIIAEIITIAVIGFLVWLMIVNLAIGIIVLVVFCGTMIRGVISMNSIPCIG